MTLTECAARAAGGADGQGQREAGSAGRHRHGRQRRGQGQRGHHPDQRPRRRHGRLARLVHQALRRADRDGPGRDAPGAPRSAACCGWLVVLCRSRDAVLLQAELITLAEGARGCETAMGGQRPPAPARGHTAPPPPLRILHTCAGHAAPRPFTPPAAHHRTHTAGGRRPRRTADQLNMRAEGTALGRSHALPSRAAWPACGRTAG